jgi:transposase
VGVIRDGFVEVDVPEIWAGVDAGKEHHHCVVIDGDGGKLLSRRVLNDETVLVKLLDEVLALAQGDPVTWAVDLNGGGAALLIGVLAAAEQRLLYISGRQVNRASGMYAGSGKTDAKDAFVIADQARIRRDVGVLRPGDDISIDLKILVARRTDLVADRTREINRLRAQLLEIFPALERAVDLSRHGHLVLLTGFQTPSAIKAAGLGGVRDWLTERAVRKAGVLARTAFTAAEAQTIALPGEKLAAAVVARLAKGVIALNQEIAEIEALIEGRFREHEHAHVIVSMPGIGLLLGAEFLAATGGDMTAFADADKLAGFAGLAPAPRDSGRISGNLKRPRRYNRSLLRVFYLSALSSLRLCPVSRAFYDRKRSEGKKHKQALLALARRRLNVLWAMIRDNRCFHVSPPVTAAA